MDQFFHLPAESFDAITLWHVLEHVHDLSAYVQQLKSLLKERGKLFIAVPNYTSKDAAIYKESWAAYDVPRHLYHFSPRSMQSLMEKHGLKLLGYKPMWYDSFYISMLSSKYKNGKTNLLASFFNGLSSNLKAMGDVKKCSSVIYVIGK
jgi:SAM-dependent methyltransferase